MDTSKIFLLIDYLREIKMVSFIGRRLTMQFTIDDALELALWKHIIRAKQLKRKSLKRLRLDKNHILETLFNGDIKSLNRTASRLYKRIKFILIDDFIEDKPLIEDWLFRASIRKIPNHLASLLSENFIEGRYKTSTSFEKDFNAYIQFHIAYEKYLEDSLKSSTDVSFFIKVRQTLEDYYVKYHSILESERLQRNRVNKNEEIAALKSPMSGKSPSLLESELLLEKISNLDKNPQHFEFCLNWLIHLVEEKLISYEMQKTIFPVLYNFGMRNITTEGESLVVKYIDKLIYLALDKKILSTNGTISVYIYVGLLSSISIYAEKISPYVNKYLTMVDKKEYDKASYISNIYIAFYNNKFEEVLTIINRNENNISLGSDASLKSKIRFFLIRVYFELKDENKFIKECANSKRFHKSLNLIKEKEDNLVYAIDFLKELYYINNTQALLRLEKKIRNRRISIKTWVLKKIKESPFYPKEQLPKTK